MICKVGCVIPMVVSSDFRIETTTIRDDASHFRIELASVCKPIADNIIPRSNSTPTPSKRFIIMIELLIHIQLIIIG